MQTLDDQLLFKRLLEMNIIEKQVKDAFDKLTDNENRDLNEKKNYAFRLKKELLNSSKKQMTKWHFSYQC